MELLRKPQANPRCEGETPQNADNLKVLLVGKIVEKCKFIPTTKCLANICFKGKQFHLRVVPTKVDSGVSSAPSRSSTQIGRLGPDPYVETVSNFSSPTMVPDIVVVQTAETTQHPNAYHGIECTASPSPVQPHQLPSPFSTTSASIIIPAQSTSSISSYPLVTQLDEPYRNPVLITGSKSVYKYPYSGAEFPTLYKVKVLDFIQTLLVQIDDDPQLNGHSTQIQMRTLMCREVQKQSPARPYPALIITCNEMLSQPLRRLLNRKRMLKLMHDHQLCLPGQPDIHDHCCVHVESIGQPPVRNLSDYFDMYLVRAPLLTEEFISHDDTYCGLKLVTHDNDRLATIACLLKSGTNFYCLTVAHAFRDSLSKDISTVLRTLVPTVLSGNTSIISSLSDASFQVIAPSGEIGHHYPDYDCALILLGRDCPLRMNTFSPVSTAQVKIPLERAANCHPCGERQVLILCANRPAVRGRLLCGTVYRQLCLGAKFVELWSIEPEDSLNLVVGDSGSLVIDAETYVIYGYVVSLDYSGMAHVVPFFCAMEQIRQIPGLESVALPSAKDIKDTANTNIGVLEVSTAHKKDSEAYNSASLLTESTLKVPTTLNQDSKIYNSASPLTNKHVVGLPRPHEQRRNYTSKSRIWLCMVATLISQFMVSFQETSILIAIPNITDEFHSLCDIAWYGSAYYMTIGAFAPGWVKVYRSFSMKIAFLWAIGIFEAGSVICAVAPSSTILIVGRAIEGTGTIGILAGVWLISLSNTSPNIRSVLYGSQGFSWILGFSIGPLIGGLLTQFVTWRWCFYINMPLGGLSALIILFFFHVPEHLKPHQASLKKKLSQLNIPATTVLLGAIICFLLALQWAGPSRTWTSPDVVGLFIGSAALLAMFIVIEITSKERVFLTFWLFPGMKMKFFLIFKFINSGVIFILFHYLPLYFQSVSGFGAKDSGIRIIPIAAATSIFGSITLVISALTGRFELAMVIGCILTTIGSGLLCTLDTSSWSVNAIGYQILAGVGQGFSNNVAVDAMLGLAVSPEAQISIMVACSSWYYLSGAIWLAVAQALFQNKLLLSLGRIQEIEPNTVFAAGATNFVSQIPTNYSIGVVESYMAGLHDAFTACIGLGGSAFVIAVLVVILSRIYRAY